MEAHCRGRGGARGRSMARVQTASEVRQGTILYTRKTTEGPAGRECRTVLTF